MRIFSRSTLKEAFPDNPRARAEFERLDAVLNDVDASGQSLTDKLDALLIAGGGSAFQESSPTLEAIAQTADDDIGVIEKAGAGQVAIRQVDSDDDTCLVSRSLLMSFLGVGASGSRPAASSKRRGIYFDTTLGKPIFWNGSGWVDATGAAA